MRILYLQTFPLWGSGSGTYARYLASEVGKRHKVAILAPDHRVPMRTKVYELKLPFPVAFTSHPEWPDCWLYENLGPKEIAAVYEAMLKASVAAVEDFQPDILHVHHLYPFSWAAKFIKEFYKINFLVTIHGSELPTAQKARNYIGPTRDALRRAKKLMPNSYWTRDWFYEVFGDNDFHKKMRVIVPGVSLERFDPNLETESLEKKYGLLPRDYVVLFAGKLTKYKGVKYLIYAAKKIPAHIFILGDGPEKENLKALVKKIGLSNVHFAGHLGSDTKKLNEFYNLADVFVAPSVWDEPLGLVILEAMACRTPVVVTRKGGIPLAVKNGVNGYFVRPKNSREIVEKVNKLLEDEKRRLKMGENARGIVERRFSWEKIATRFERIYEKYRKKS